MAGTVKYKLPPSNSHLTTPGTRRSLTSGIQERTQCMQKCKEKSNTATRVGMTWSPGRSKGFGLTMKREFLSSTVAAGTNSCPTACLQLCKDPVFPGHFLWRKGQLHFHQQAREERKVCSDLSIRVAHR